MIDISTYLTSVGAMAALVTLVTGWLSTHVSAIAKANSTWKQVTAWAVSIAVAFVSAYLGVGVATGLNILWTVINGLAVGLVANGLFDVALVQSVLIMLKARKPRAPEVN
jgi:hypothetical protein